MMTDREEREFYEMSRRYDSYLEEVEDEEECMSFEQFEMSYFEQVQEMLEEMAQVQHEEHYA